MHVILTLIYKQYSDIQSCKVATNQYENLGLLTLKPSFHNANAPLRFFKGTFIYLFTGCIGSSLPHVGFL